MAYPYSWTYSGSTGAILTGWQENAGGTFTVGSSGFSSTTNGDVTLYTASGALSGSGRIQMGLVDFWVSSANYSNLNAVLMSQDATDVNNNYLINFKSYPLIGFYAPTETGNTATLFKLVGGTATPMGSIQGWLPAASGSPVTLQAQVIVTGNNVQIGYIVNGVLILPTDWVDTTTLKVGGVNPYTAGYYGLFHSLVSTGTKAYVTSVNIDNNVTLPNSTVIASRGSASPLLARGATYNTKVGDGLQGAIATWDATGNQWVMAIGNWNQAASAWSAFLFTSPDLYSSCTYVNNSLMLAASPNTIVGGFGVMRIPAGFTNAGSFALCYYPDVSPSGFPICIQVASALTGFTNGPSTFVLNAPTYASIIAKGSADSYAQADCKFVNGVNPVTGHVEIVYTGVQTSANGARTLMISDSADFVSWSAGTAVVSSDPWDAAAVFGAPGVYYANGPDGSTNARWWTWDAGATPGLRCKGIGWQKYLGSNTWGAIAKIGVNLYSYKPNSWEATAVCDGQGVGLYDRGDGNGAQLWTTYCGNANPDPTSNTQSGVGMAFFSQPLQTIFIPQSFTEQPTLQRPTVAIPYD